MTFSNTSLSFSPVQAEMKPRIAVIGVGGGGGNAVDNMITEHLEGVDFFVANTDAQVLAKSLTDKRIQLGPDTTHGLGAGADPTVGQEAAEKSIQEILDQIGDADMVFITAGMGGGTGTGAAPVIARAVRERGILTVGVVTKPFNFEGSKRMRLAEQGLSELQRHVDTLIVIPNQNLFRIANENTTFADAFKLADNVLYMGVRGVTDLIVMPGLINLDFADVRTVMKAMGKAMMGSGEAEGDNRAREAAEAAISNPLLDDISLAGAKAVLVNITAGHDLRLMETDEAISRIREEVDEDAHIIFGAILDPALEGQLRVSVIATGMDSESVERALNQQSARPAGPGMFARPQDGGTGAALHEGQSRFFQGQQGGARPAPSTPAYQNPYAVARDRRPDDVVQPQLNSAADVAGRDGLPHGGQGGYGADVYAHQAPQQHQPEMEPQTPPRRGFMDRITSAVSRGNKNQGGQTPPNQQGRQQAPQQQQPAPQPARDDDTLRAFDEEEPREVGAIPSFLQKQI